ncbi:glycosyltransferase family 4 protein [Microbacterium sp. CCNWLW134]|uniref:glycosyltransferase family 4 protein n=1 Tax=Microbacterium sp. CCNWLW134 TaxID=3122064 RepID=UPI0030103B9C
MSKNARPVMLHVGIYGDRPGGIAQVVNQYLEWGHGAFEAWGVLSTRGRRDWAAPFLWVTAGLRLLWARMRYGRSIVLVHLSANGSFIREGSLALLSRFLGHKVGLHLHGSQFPDFSRRRPGIVKAVCGSAQVVFVLTDESKRILDSTLRGKRTRLVRLWNAVEVPPDVPTKTKTILFAGEVGHRKGVDVLLAAWDQLIDIRRDWILILAGPTTADVPLTRFSGPSIRVVGAVPHEEVLVLQSRASIAVLPSRNEAMPMFLLESMARACAVVATPVGQVEELVRDAGLLVHVGDSASLADALRQYMTSPVLLREAARAARERVKTKYSADGIRQVLELEWSRLAKEEVHKRE